MNGSETSTVVTMMVFLLAAAATALIFWRINDYCLKKQGMSAITLLSDILKRWMSKSPQNEELIFIVTDKGIFKNNTPLYWGRPDDWVLTPKELTIIEDGVSRKIPLPPE